MMLLVKPAAIKSLEEAKFALALRHKERLDVPCRTRGNLGCKRQADRLAQGRSSHHYCSSSASFSVCAHSSSAL